ncbi:MAG: hydantoinase/oxoprolinase family protein [Lautropia sp.]
MPTRPSHPGTIRLAADIGGTFTDVVLETPARRYSCKVPTTPRQPERAVQEGIARLLAESGVAAGDVALFIHGTTLATNALIERKGARTGLLTTAGFRDVLEMGFEKRFEQYDIDIERPAELVPRPLRLTVPERVAADGTVLLPLDEDAVAARARELKAAGVEAVAIGFLHAYSWPAHEQRARAIASEILGPDVTICLSSEVCPEMREYERFSTTCANAYVRPLMAGYLTRLERLIAADGLTCPLLLMMSGGGITTLAHAARFPIRLVESGPAGGAILAAQLARECGYRDVMAFDMGGTTAKICLIGDGRPERSRRFEVGRVYRNLKGSGLPIRIPVIELVEIGAGGGSIGRVDALSRITVGPDSAGAEPGPACYRKGGTEPAVTDANLVLGRIDPERFAAGRMPLDRGLAEQALTKHIGTALGMDAFWSAAGVSEIVEENMANAARVHAIERGKSIRDFTMIAFGGAAPLHAGRLAQKLGIDRVVIPAGAGVGSAIGFLRAPIAFEVVRSDNRVLADCAPDEVNARLAAMRAEALAVVGPAVASGSGSRIDDLAEERLVELRYAGQGHELRIAVPDGTLDRAALAALTERFEAEYQRVYGLRIAGSAVEIVSWLLTLSTPAPAVTAAVRAPVRHDAAATGRRDVWEPALGAAAGFGVHWRFDLAGDARVAGPALVEEHETTTVVPAGWHAGVDSLGNLILEAA